MLPLLVGVSALVPVVPITHARAPCRVPAAQMVAMRPFGSFLRPWSRVSVAAPSDDDALSAPQPHVSEYMTHVSKLVTLSPDISLETAACYLCQHGVSVHEAAHDRTQTLLSLPLHVPMILSAAHAPRPRVRLRSCRAHPSWRAACSSACWYRLAGTRNSGLVSLPSERLMFDLPGSRKRTCCTALRGGGACAIRPPAHVRRVTSSMSSACARCSTAMWPA